MMFDENDVKNININLFYISLIKKKIKETDTALRTTEIKNGNKVKTEVENIEPTSSLSGERH